MDATPARQFRDPLAPDTFWATLQQDIAQIKRDMVSKTELMAMLANKADAGVSEERWKGVWQDVAEIRTEMRQRPQQQAQSFFQAMGCSMNALLIMVGAGSMLGTVAAVVVSIIALVR